MRDRRQKRWHNDLFAPDNRVLLATTLHALTGKQIRGLFELVKLSQRAAAGAAAQDFIRVAATVEYPGYWVSSYPAGC